MYNFSAIYHKDTFILAFGNAALITVTLTYGSVIYPGKRLKLFLKVSSHLNVTRIPNFTSRFTFTFTLHLPP